MLSKPNKVPANTCRAKKLVSPFTMGVERTHACLNHRILYRGDAFKDMDKCPVCSADRYKNNDGTVAAIIMVQETGTKGRGRVQRIVLQRHQILL